MALPTTIIDLQHWLSVTVKQRDRIALTNIIDPNTRQSFDVR
jgi:hypothetical protein